MNEYRKSKRTYAFPTRQHEVAAPPGKTLRIKGVLRLDTDGLTESSVRKRTSSPSLPRRDSVRGKIRAGIQSQVRLR